MTNSNPFKIAVDNLNIDSFEVSFDTVTHQASNGKTQIFQDFKVVVRDTNGYLGTSTFDGVVFSDWMLIQDGEVYIAADSYEVDYNAEHHGEDLELVKMENIHLPAADEDNMYLAKKMVKVLQEAISKHFKLDHHFPIVEFDHPYPAGCR